MTGLDFLNTYLQDVTIVWQATLHLRVVRMESCLLGDLALLKY